MAASKDNARAILSYATPNPVGPYKLVTPIAPPTGAGKTKTPIMPVMGGTLVNVPTPVMPTKQTTPIAPPLPGRLVNVPTQQGRVVDKAAIRKPEDYEKLPANDYLRRAYEEKLADFQRQSRQYGLPEDTTDPYAAMDQVEENLRIARRAGFKGERAKRLAYEFPKLERDETYMFFFDTARQQPGKRRDDLSDYVEALKVVTRGVQDLNDAEFETWASLREGWNGTAKELLEAAKSLSK